MRLRIGSGFGIPIYLHWTFFLLPLWIWYNDQDQLVLALTILPLMFGCVVLHEFGHALMARYFGIRTRDITLYPIGGVARLERLSDRPHEELLIALAGPAVNVAIALLLFPFTRLSADNLELFARDQSLLSAFVTGVFAIN